MVSANTVNVFMQVGVDNVKALYWRILKANFESKLVGNVSTPQVCQFCCKTCYVRPKRRSYPGRNQYN